jgi:ComF family protein
MKFWRDILNIFFPEVCLCCGVTLSYNENVCCVPCIHELPLTNFSLEKKNLVEQSFYGRVPLYSATSLFYFYKNGRIQQLIYHLKYKGQQQIGRFAGHWLAEEMLSSGRFKGIQFIIPVPLHRKREKDRGYNQVTTFGETLSEKLSASFHPKNLKRVSAFESQTKKIRFDRWKNVQDQFVLGDSRVLENTHVLLIDDVITTGATIVSCYEALKEVSNIKISIASIAYTK